MQAVLLEDRGEGTPVVYVPGVDGTGRYLLATEERIAARFRLVILRYESEEGGDRIGDTYEALAGTVRRRLDELGIERALVLTESFGGGVSLQLALDDRERVAGLMIVNSFAAYPWRGRLALSRGLAPLVPGSLYRSLRPFLAPPALFHPRRDPDALRRFLEHPGALVGEGYRRRLHMIRRLDLRPRLGEIRIPVALFAADCDRIVDSVPAGRVMHAALPDSTFEVLPRAGHLVLPLAEEPWVERLEALAARAGLA
jgi:pimeloyl-ACP methyl ester carboxylesterase